MRLGIVTVDDDTVDLANEQAAYYGKRYAHYDHERSLEQFTREPAVRRQPAAHAGREGRPGAAQGVHRRMPRPARRE